MPTVPVYDNLRTSIAPAPDTAPRGPGPMQIAGQQMGALGESVSRAGNALQAVAIDELNRANQVRVIDALDQLKQEQLRLTHDQREGFTNLRGADALQRPDGKALSDEYGGRLQSRAEALAASLGNDVQRLEFKRQAGGMLTAFRGQAMAHEAGEFKSYSLSKYEASIGTAQQEVALSWNKPDAVANAVQRMQAAAYEVAKLQGKSAEWADNMAKRMASNGHAVALGAALDAGSLDYAQGYLKKFAGSMEADDILRVQGQMTKAMDARQAVQAVERVLPQLQREANPSDFDRMVALTIKAESGGRRYGADGKLLTSSAGAKGEMQVLDSTNLNPGFGVKPAASDSPDERARVGRDYLAAMLKRYDGDPAKAWAAYNAGPGRLDEALMRAGARPGGEWLAMMPAETQAYVAKNLQALQGGERPPAPTLQDLHQRVDAQMANARPEARAQARQLATKQWEDMQAARKQRDDEAVADAMRALQENGGRFSDLPPSMRASLPPKEVDNLMNYAARLAKGDDTTNPAVYQRLSDPAVLSRMSDAAFFAMRRELSQADWQRFADLRGKSKAGGGGGPSPGDLAEGTIRGAVDEHLRAMKMDPTPKDGSDDAARVGTIRKFLNDEIARAQAQAGKKFSDVEVRQFVARTFAQQALTGRFFGADVAAPMLGMTAGAIPSEAKKALRADFKARGVADPSEAQLLEAYWTAVSRRPRQVGMAGGGGGSF